MRIALYLVSLLVVSLSLHGCVNKEPEERVAFIAWLQAHVVDAPSAVVPALDETQMDALGDYAAQYDVLNDFQALAHEQMLHLANTFEHEKFGALAQLTARRDVLKADHQALVVGRQAMQQAQVRGAADRAQWEQPADLQPVYARAYEKIVTKPAAEIEELTETALIVLEDALRVVDFIDQYADQVIIGPDSAAVRDPSVQRQLNLLLETLNSRAGSLERAEVRLRALQAR